jgi:hypothetical protein
MEVPGRVLARRGIAAANVATRLALEEQPKKFPELGTPRTHREFSVRENPRVLALPNVHTTLPYGPPISNCNFALMTSCSSRYFCKLLLLEVAA